MELLDIILVSLVDVILLALLWSLWWIWRGRCLQVMPHLPAMEVLPGAPMMREVASVPAVPRVPGILLTGEGRRLLPGSDTTAPAFYDSEGNRIAPPTYSEAVLEREGGGGARPRRMLRHGPPTPYLPRRRRSYPRHRIVVPPLPPAADQADQPEEQPVGGGAHNDPPLETNLDAPEFVSPDDPQAVGAALEERGEQPVGDGESSSVAGAVIRPLTAFQRRRYLARLRLRLWWRRRTGRFHRHQN